MKIAAKTSLATLAVFVGVGACLMAGSALAQTTSGSAGALPPGILTSPSSAVEAPVAASSAPAPAAAAAPMAEAPSPAALAKAVGVPSLNGPVAPGAAGADVRIPDSVKGVVKKLSTETGDVTVEDLNEARQAVAKLDLLLDIEKRMSDLTLLRLEREEKKNAMSSTNNLAGALPASALGLGAVGKAGTPPNLSPQMLEMMKNLGLAPAGSAAALPEKEKEKPAASIEVDRIIGAAGKHIAVMRVGTDKAKQFRVGDKLSDGSVVESISSQGVVVSDTKKGQRTIQVRDVNTIFGAR